MGRFVRKALEIFSQSSATYRNAAAINGVGRAAAGLVVEPKMHTASTSLGLRLLRTTIKLWLFAVALIVPLGLIYAVDQHYLKDKFIFTEINIDSEYDHRGTEIIQQAILSELDGNYFTANLQRLAHKVSEFSWIGSVSVYRQWPNTLVVSLKPVNPVVRWNDRQWIGYAKEVLDIPPFLEVHEIDHLPILTGGQGDAVELFEAYLDWSEKFAAWGLTLDALKTDEEKIWRLELSLGALSKNKSLSAHAMHNRQSATSPVRMVVNEENAMVRIPRFVASLDLKLIDQFEQIESIDLRYTNGFAIRWKQEQTQKALAMNNPE